MLKFWCFIILVFGTQVRVNFNHEHFLSSKFTVKFHQMIFDAKQEIVKFLFSYWCLFFVLLGSVCRKFNGEDVLKGMKFSVKLKMLQPKSVKKTRPRHKHKVQLGSLLTGESSLLIFVKWEKHAMPQLIHKDARRQLMRASHQRWEEMKLADQWGGVREADTMVSSEPTKLIYEK